MKNTVEITIKKTHFDAAVAAVSKQFALTSSCLLAQAIKGAYPKKKVHVYSTSAHIGNKTFDLSTKAVRLIERFDNLHLGYNELMSESWTKGEKTRIAKFRASFPVTFKMTEEVAEKAVAATA